MKRGISILYLHFIIVILILGNLLGIYKVVYMRDQMISSYPGISKEFQNLLIAIPVLSIVALIGIWFRKKWGMHLIVLNTICVLLLDIKFDFWTHAIAVFLSFTFLLLGYLLNRKEFV